MVLSRSRVETSWDLSPPKAMEGELGTLSVEFDNRRDIDIPSSMSELIVMWSDDQNAKPRLREWMEPVLQGDRAIFGPFETPVQKVGVARVFLPLRTWPGVDNFQNSQGGSLPHDQHQDWIPPGRFRSSTRQRLHRQIGIGLAVVAVAVAIIFGTLALLP